MSVPTARALDKLVVKSGWYVRVLVDGITSN